MKDRNPKGAAYRIVVEWSEDDDAWVARVPALPNCVAHGESAEEALREARVALMAMLKVLGTRAPRPDTPLPSGNIRLRLPRFLHADLERRAALEEVSLNQLMVTLLSQGVGPSVAKPKARVRRATAAR